MPCDWETPIYSPLSRESNRGMKEIIQATGALSCDNSIGFGALAEEFHPSRQARAAFGIMLLLPLCLGQHRDRFGFVFLQSGIDARQFFCRELLEIGDHIFQFARQRIFAGNLVLARAAFVSVDRAVELAEVLTDPLFAGDHAAL